MVLTPSIMDIISRETNPGGPRLAWLVVLYYDMRLKSLAPNRMSLPPTFLIILLEEFLGVLDLVYHFED